MNVLLRIALACFLVCTLCPLAAQEPSAAQPWYPNERLCKSMFGFAESARSHPRMVRLSLRNRAPRSSWNCRDGSSRAGRELCRELGAAARQFATAVIAQEALACLGIGAPLGDPEAIVSHSFYISGRFDSEPPHFADGKVRLTLELDARDETAMQWIAITATPVD